MLVRNTGGCSFNFHEEAAMKNRFLWMVLSVVALMAGAQPALAASAAVREMAGIMMHLEHYPSDAEKARLNAIAADQGSSAQERVIATAMLNLKHHAAAGDVDKLKMVSGDISAPVEVRELAGIVLSLNHMPSTADKGKLETMLK